MAAERVGFHGVWTYDHLSGVSLNADWTLDPWIVLAAIAQATHYLTLGPLVLNTPARHPARIALAAATLQGLSKGRLMVGLGAGSGPGRWGRELEMLDLPVLGASDRRAVTEESICALRALWDGHDFAGTHFSCDGLEAFLMPTPAPPVIVGANGPKMAALAGRVADGVNLHSYEEDLEALVDTARSAAGTDSFLVTVEAPAERHWLDGDGRALLERLGTDRVQYRWTPADGIAAIETIADSYGLTRYESDTT